MPGGTAWISSKPAGTRASGAGPAPCPLASTISDGRATYAGRSFARAGAGAGAAEVFFGAGAHFSVNLPSG